jgi:hypothetical protein
VFPGGTPPTVPLPPFTLPDPYAPAPPVTTTVPAAGTDFQPPAYVPPASPTQAASPFFPGVSR